MKEGEIVQVQGGHIIRATGRKDRHSKVYTAKGPRDRRVRLSAHTAIQFYDVQDRLGYDRPSKAVDWLMKKAKSAIDKLAELPPFDPAAGITSTAGNGDVGRPDLGVGESTEAARFEIGQFQNPGNPMGFSGYPNQDLCLSLQSFQNPGNPGSSHGLFPVGFEAGGSNGNWVSAPEAGLGDMGQFSRLLAWNGGGFHPQPSIRAWDDLPMGPASGDDHRIPKDEMQQQAVDGFMGFCVPTQIHGGGDGNLAYHHHQQHQHRHNSGSSMSTDSSR